MEPDGVDWLAHKDGSVIDFRLESDPITISPDVLRERRHEYLAQYREQMRTNKRTTRMYLASRSRGLFGFASDEN